MKNKIKPLLLIIVILNFFTKITTATSGFVIEKHETPPPITQQHNHTYWQPLGFYAHLGDTFALSGLGDLALFDQRAEELQPQLRVFFSPTPSDYLKQIGTTNLFASIANLIFSITASDTSLANLHRSRAIFFGTLGATSVLMSNSRLPIPPATISAIRTLTALKIASDILYNHYQIINNQGLAKHLENNFLEIMRDVFYGLTLVDLWSASTHRPHALAATSFVGHLLNYLSLASSNSHQKNTNLTITSIISLFMGYFQYSNLSYYPRLFEENAIRFLPLISTACFLIGEKLRLIYPINP